LGRWVGEDNNGTNWEFIFNDNGWVRYTNNNTSVVNMAFHINGNTLSLFNTISSTGIPNYIITFTIYKINDHRMALYNNNGVYINTSKIS
jgi:hypothetical protein